MKKMILAVAIASAIGNANAGFIKLDYQGRDEAIGQGGIFKAQIAGYFETESGFLNYIKHDDSSEWTATSPWGSTGEEFLMMCIDPWETVDTGDNTWYRIDTYDVFYNLLPIVGSDIWTETTLNEQRLVRNILAGEFENDFTSINFGNRGVGALQSILWEMAGGADELVDGQVTNQHGIDDYYTSLAESWLREYNNSSFDDGGNSVTLYGISRVSTNSWGSSGVNYRSPAQDFMIYTVKPSESTTVPTPSPIWLLVAGLFTGVFNWRKLI